MHTFTVSAALRASRRVRRGTGGPPVRHALRAALQEQWCKYAASYAALHA